MDTANMCDVNLCGDGAPVARNPNETVTGWANWTKVNSRRFQSKSHGDAYVDVFVEAQYVDTYRSLEEVPAGMRVVKAQYREQVGGSPVGLTVMSKQGAGFDSENGDWSYGVFDAAGGKASKQGKLASCIACHSGASDTDYLHRAEE